MLSTYALIVDGLALLGLVAGCAGPRAASPAAIPPLPHRRARRTRCNTQW